MTRYYIKHNGNKEACQVMFKHFHGYYDSWIAKREQEVLDACPYYVCDSVYPEAGTFTEFKPDCTEFTIGRRRPI